MMQVCHTRPKGARGLRGCRRVFGVNLQNAALVCVQGSVRRLHLLRPNMQGHSGQVDDRRLTTLIRRVLW